MTNTRNYILTLIAAVIVGALLFTGYRSVTSSPSQTATSTATGSNATTTTIDGVTFTGSGVTVEEVAAGEKPTVQSFIVTARNQKNAGNYAGAIATLNQGAVLYPSDVVINNNLGDIYMNFAKDYVKAEATYKKVIAVNPNYLDAYRHLLELYTTTSYKPTNTAAADIVVQALKALPKAYDLQVMLARYYRDTNQMSLAKATYQAAIDNAKGQELTSIAASIEAELKALPQ